MPADFTVTVREKLDPDNAVTTKSVVYSIGKLKEGSQGVSAAIVYLYKMAASVPASIDDTTSFPTLTVSMSTGKIINAAGYSISSNQIMDGSGGGTGWYTVPTDTSVTDGVQWVSAATASNAGDADTIPRTEWTDPVQFSGSGGDRGISSALVELYQLPANSADTPGSAPRDPDQTLTYTFSDGLLKNSAGATSGTGFSSWSRTASTPTETHKYLWKITAPAIAAGDSDAIVTSDWAAAIVAAQYGSEGAVGKRGKRTFSSTLYYSTGKTSSTALTSSDLPSGGTYDFDNKAFSHSDIVADPSSATNKWSLTSPTFAAYDTNDPPNKLYWFACSVNVEESVDGGGNPTGSGTPTYSNVHVIHNFFGVVAFSDLENDTTTKIHGSNIETGTIKGDNFDNSSGTMGGMLLELRARSGTDKIIHAKDTAAADTFYVTANGNAYFKGQIAAGQFTGTGSTTGDINVGSSANVKIDGAAQQIIINDGSNDRVILGKLS